MTTVMSSISDGIDDISEAPHRRTTSKRDQEFPTSQRDGSTYRNNGRISGHETPSTFERRSSNEIPSRKRKARESGASPFLVANGSGKTLSRSHTQGHSFGAKDNGSPGSSKSRSSAVGRSPLGIDVMNTGDEMADTEHLRTTRQPSGAYKRKVTNPSAYDTQFVNLALSLSDSRRRHFSNNGLPSPMPSNGRIVSTGFASPLPSTPYSKGVHQPQLRDSTDSGYLQDSPNSRYQSDSMRSSESIKGPGIAGSPVDIFGLPIVTDEEFHPSEKTLQRVQQAKDFIELSHEYRRLLQYLPKLPTNNHAGFIQSTWTSGQAACGSSALGMQYNPLQFIRNRKVRRREDNPLNAECQGWKSTADVRDWVNAVIDSRRSHVSSTNNLLPLPPFTQPTQDNDSSSDVAVPAKEKRPRVEWMIAPWNLLADAYWLEQDDHKHLIEDSKSRKIFPVARSLPRDTKSNIIRPSTRRSASISRSIKDISSIIAEDRQPRSRGSVDIDRGRRPHIRDRSSTDNREYSGSRSRKHAWRRFIGSQSPSSTEDSGSRGRQGSTQHRGITTRERYDNRILEKQIADLVSKQQHQSAHSRPDGDLISGLRSRSSSSGSEKQPQDPPLSLVPRRGSRLAAIDHGKEMQPRRFSSNLGLQDRPQISINVSPPRSRSRSAHILKTSMSRGTLDSSSTDEVKRLSPKSAHRPRGSFEFDTKIRGIFRDSKITNIVSRPVTKVGELLWRRDHSEHDLLNSPPGTDDEDIAAEKNLRLERLETNNTTSVPDGYRPADLPVFTSPFRGHKRGRSAENNKVSPSIRDISRTPPPRLQLNRSANVSPSRSSIRTPGDMVSSGALNLARPELTRQNTQRRDAITAMGDHSSAHPDNRQNQPLWPEVDPLHYLNITSRLLTPLHRKIRHKDIAALRALTRCSQASALDITQQISKPNDASGRSIHAVSRRRLAETGSHVAVVKAGNDKITMTLQTFTAITMPNVHTSLQALESRIIDTLTPSVRDAGDAADKLLAELATTRTLEVKKLNDELDMIARRQRRKFRWVQRAGYWALEWTVVGLMWWIWAVVFAFRVVRGTIRGIFGAGRWLLWL